MAHDGGLTLVKVLTDIPIDIVLLVFVSAVIYIISSYAKIGKQLKLLYQFISKFKKSDLNFRFREIDEGMSANKWVSHTWNEFKNTLVFSESVALTTQNHELIYKEASSTIQNIQTTVDPLYFFSPEALVDSKFNKKLVEQFPTVLTGCGPLFTFMNIVHAFGQLDFTSSETILRTVSGLMSIMQIAALVSVIAVGCSLFYILLEKVLWNMLVVKNLEKASVAISSLFDNISSEKFLLELLKETKIQNNAISNLVAAMPEDFKKALVAGLAGNIVPYLENVIFGVNQLNKSIKDMEKDGGDLF